MRLEDRLGEIGSQGRGSRMTRENGWDLDVVWGLDGTVCEDVD